MKFFKEVIQTMKDTTWENARETRKDTSTVVTMSILLIIFTMSILLIIFFAVIDAAVQGLISFI